MPCTFALINALIKVHGAASSSSTAIVATTSSRNGIMTPRWFRYEAVGSHPLDLVPEISLVQVIVNISLCGAATLSTGVVEIRMAPQIANLSCASVAIEYP